MWSWQAPAVSWDDKAVGRVESWFYFQASPPLVPRGSRDGSGGGPIDAFTATTASGFVRALAVDGWSSRGPPEGDAFAGSTEHNFEIAALHQDGYLA